MDPLEQIKQILVENEEKMADNDNGKAMQMKNVESTRSQQQPGEMPGKGGEVILKGPGVDVIQQLLSKIPAATRPQDDPKAKNTSRKMSFSATDTNLDGDKSHALDFGAAKGGRNSVETEESDEGEEPESEQSETENEEVEAPMGKKMIKEKKPTMEEHLGALFNGETLSEDFKQKAALIFDTALQEREEAIRQEVCEEYEALAEEYVDIKINEINEQVDSYLGYVVNEWVEENRLQLENGVRLEIAESFIEGLRTLFVEHGVDVPDSDINLVDELSARIDDLQETLNQEINRNIELNEAVESYRRNEVVATLGEDLTAAEFDRFTKLCENVSYDSDENFINKINTIKESYFNESPTSASPVNYLTESVDEESVNQPTEINESMDQYVQTLARFGKK